MPSFSDYVASIRTTLAASDPDLKTHVGSTTRKIIDAVAQALTEASVDSFVLDYAYDLNARSGADLDELARLFGFTRSPARRATGEVTFERNRALDPLAIPQNTQLSDGGAPPVLVNTTTTAVLGIGDYSITVPVMALDAGVKGNIPAHGIRRLEAGIGTASGIGGIAGFDNAVALTGGADAETDEQFRQRIKRTIFRSMAGTEQQYLGTALEDLNVTQANVIGASKRRREQIELVGEPPAATSTVDNAASIYPDTSAFGTSLDGDGILTPGVHYDFDHTVNPPTVTSLDSDLVPEGVYELEFDYVPLASRNSPDDFITNRVDIWVQGTRAVEAVESQVWPDPPPQFVTDEGDPLELAKFERKDESNPVEGNVFIRLAYSPVLDPSVDDEIVINGVTYVENTDYWVVNRVDAFGLAPRSLAGLEWRTEANGGHDDPPAGEPFVVNYLYNEVPRSVEQAVQAWRVVNSDVWVHQAKPIRLNLYYAAILAPGADLNQVTSEMEAVTGALMDRVGFGGVLQASDLLAAAHGVAGVDAVRFLHSGEGASYAIERVNANGAFMERYASGGYAIDVVTDDDSIPVLNSITIVPKAQNTLNTVA